MSLTFELAGHGASLVIEVLDYERPASQDISDTNWLTCHVLIKVGPFHADFAAPFKTFDFAQFWEEFRGLLSGHSGTASFLTDEEVLRLSVTLTRTPGAQIEGVARVYGRP